MKLHFLITLENTEQGFPKKEKTQNNKHQHQNTEHQHQISQLTEHQ